MTHFLFLILFLLSSCSIRLATPQDRKGRSQVKKSLSRDEVLRGYVRKKIPRKGKFSTVTDGFVTTETFRREDGESIFILEKGELRVETETRKSGFTLTRTWQDGVMTSMTVYGKKRTTLVYFDKEGEFLNKIITVKDKETPYCYHYQGDKPTIMDDASCLGLIPDFD